MYVLNIAVLFFLFFYWLSSEVKKSCWFVADEQLRLFLYWMVQILLGKQKLCSGYSLDYKINPFFVCLFFLSHYTIQHCSTSKRSPDHFRLLTIAFTWQSVHRGKAAELDQGALHCSISWGKVTVEGFFYWKVLLEACAGHAMHPSSYRGNRTAQHELHVLLGYLSLFVWTLYIPNMSFWAECQFFCRWH